METPSLEDRVMQSLARVRTGSGGPDVVEAGVIRAVTASPDGAVRIDVAILPGVPQDIADTIRLVATGVPGVSRAIVDLAQAAGGPPEGTVPATPPPANSASVAGPGQSRRGNSPPERCGTAARRTERDRRELGQGGSREVHGVDEPRRSLGKCRIPCRSDGCGYLRP